MKRAIIICLALITLITFESSAEAGRRKDRRAAKKGGGGIYSGAYQRRSSSSSYPVAKASYQQSATQHETLAAAPDLTITEITSLGESLSFTVKNVGQTDSPETRLEVALAPNANASQLDVQNVRVLPLLPNQSVRIRINSIPGQNFWTNALVDPDQLVAESNEQNNDLRVTLAGEQVAAGPPTLAEEHNWSQAAK